ncbi:uncharacterized protein BX664DRAFT_323710 [Halteromyces radiatus]|uniref:uncharacterized protein n=1 Tax=Halteromyces radiatus TaxID=101107 RepID=UPI00221ECF2A|nr:uncharacterized protein BX664DRAFT_323710 [Halteromyces radiatus]KAI8096342.1 hypothetical protein BX664DRAFT_323710 [Halteromyces radiatus]
MGTPILVYGLHDFVSERHDEISFKVCEPITVTETDDAYMDGWWKGRNSQGQEGLFPRNYTTIMPLTSRKKSSATTLSMSAQTRNNKRKESHKDPEQWNLYQVTAWLSSIGMESLSSLFIEQEITGDILLDLTMDSLKELGVRTFGKRYRIIQEIQRLRSVIMPENIDTTISSNNKSASNNISISSQSESTSLPSPPLTNFNLTPSQSKTSSPIENAMFEYPRKAPPPPTQCYQSHDNNLNSATSTTTIKHTMNISRPLSPPSTISTNISRSNTSSSYGTSIHSGERSPDSQHTTFASIRHSFQRKHHKVDDSTKLHLANTKESIARSSSPVTMVAPIHEGWLYKRGDKYKKWNKRWFELKDDHLYYYSHPKDSHVRGVIKLQGYRIQSDPAMYSGKYCFKAHHDRERTFYFYTEKESSMKQWVNVLMKATITRDYHAPVMSSNPVNTVSLALARQMRPRPPSILMLKSQQFQANESTMHCLPNKTSLHSSSDTFDVLSDDDEDLIDPDQSIFHRSSQSSSTVVKSALTTSANDDHHHHYHYRHQRSSTICHNNNAKLSSTLTSCPELQDHKSTDDKYVSWINSYLPSGKKIVSLASAFCDGESLIVLLEQISQKHVRRTHIKASNSISMKRLENIVAAFKFMGREGIAIENYTIKDIFDGDVVKVRVMVTAIQAWANQY